MSSISIGDVLERLCVPVPIPAGEALAQTLTIPVLANTIQVTFIPQASLDPHQPGSIRYSARPSILSRAKFDPGTLADS